MRQHVSKFFALAALTAATSLAARAQTITTQIEFPSFITEGIVVDPFLNSIFVVSPSGYPDIDDTVAVIDGNTDTILTNISVPVGAYYPAVDLSTDRVFVASCNTFIALTPCFVTVIDGRSNTVMTTIPITTIKDGFLSGITADSATSLIYVSDYTDGTIVVIDGKKNTVKQTISLNGAKPYGLAINSFNDLLYVTLGSNKIDLIDAHTDKITPISTGAGTESQNVAVDLLSGKVYVVNTQFGPSSLIVLSSAGKVLATVPSGQASYGVDVDPFTHFAFVAAVNNGNTDVFTGNYTQETPIEGTSPFFLSVNPFSQKVYNAGGGMVTVTTE